MFAKKRFIYFDKDILPIYYRDMPKRSRKVSCDLNHLAASIVNEATAEKLLQKAAEDGKNPAAVLLGRLGGLKGGKARAKKLTAQERSKIAKKAASARWNTKS